MTQAEKTTSDSDRGPSVRLATLSRGDTVAFHIEWATFKGKHYVSLRQWNKAADGSWRPDPKRGCSIKRGELASVIEALNKALELASEGRG